MKKDLEFGNVLFVRKIKRRRKKTKNILIIFINKEIFVLI
jgi:hypothetical protein